MKVSIITIYLTVETGGQSIKAFWDKRLSDVWIYHNRDGNSSDGTQGYCETYSSISSMFRNQTRACMMPLTKGFWYSLREILSGFDAFWRSHDSRVVSKLLGVEEWVRHRRYLRQWVCYTNDATEKRKLVRNRVVEPTVLII
jgi:hypothetical protein